MSDVTTYDDRTVQRETGSHWIFVEDLQDIGHWLIQVNLHGITLTGLTQLLRNQLCGIGVEFLNPNTLFVDLTLDVTVC